MYAFLTILAIIACVLLVLIILVQNPKGGGLSATFGGTGNQFLGVQRTTDILEKATWTLAIVVLVLSLGMNFFINRQHNTQTESSQIEGKIQNVLPPMENLPQAPIENASPVENKSEEGKK